MFQSGRRLSFRRSRFEEDEVLRRTVDITAAVASARCDADLTARRLSRRKRHPETCRKSSGNWHIKTFRIELAMIILQLYLEHVGSFLSIFFVLSWVCLPRTWVRTTGSPGRYVLGVPGVALSSCFVSSVSSAMSVACDNQN